MLMTKTVTVKLLSASCSGDQPARGVPGRLIILFD
jgi:hypothetical protein